MAKYQKMSDAAKSRMANRQRDGKGKFAKDQLPAVVSSTPMLPPQADAPYASQFVAIPNPVNGIFYNPDVAFQSNQENATRMIQDMAIYSALQERQLALAGLDWSIVPTDENDLEQKEGCDKIENIIRNFLPNWPDFIRNLADSQWYGRSACTMNYQWDFSRGGRQMVPVGWTPIHGDSLIFGEDGRVGYRVGAVAPQTNVIVTVEGRAVMIDDEPVVNGGVYLSPAKRKAWIVHHYQKTAGEFRLFASAAAIYGVGLRSRCYPIWLLKQSLMQFYMQYAEKFGAGWIIGYFDGSNQKSADAVQAALQKQVGSCVQMFPRFAPGEDAVEGLEVVNPPTGSEALLKGIEYYDKQLRQTICGENLTSDNKGGAGMGSGVAKAHENTFARLIRYDALSMGETLSDQLVSVLQEFNDLDHLPPFKLKFSLDVGSIDEKLERAKKLYDMGIKVSATELITAAGFTVPKEDEIQTHKDQIADSAPADEENQGNLENKND